MQNRCFAGLALCILLAFQPGIASAQAQRALISHAEKPAKLIRKTAVYDAPQGSSLQPGDIVESAERGVQLELPNGALLALGPRSSVLLDATSGEPAVSLLRGWLKLASGKTGTLQATAGVLQLRATAGGGAIAHLESDKTELFAEASALAVTDLDAGADPAQSVARDQYAVRRKSQPLQVQPRPPRIFVNGMPRAFFDPLLPVGGKAALATPVQLREVEVGDLDDWNDVSPAVHARVVLRFSARLADAVFRKDAEAQLSSSAEWRSAIARSAEASRKRNNTTNILF